MILFITFCCFGETKKYALDLSCGASISSSGFFYFPTPSLSFYWLRSRLFHEFSSEFFYNSNIYNNGNNKIWYVEIGLSYSLMFRLGTSNLFIGPTIGLFANDHQSDTMAHQQGVWMSENRGDAGLYFLGPKLAYIFGDKTVRFKIQDRLLVGMNGTHDPTRSNHFAVLNTINASIIFAFGNKNKLVP